MKLPSFQNTREWVNLAAMWITLIGFMVSIASPSFGTLGWSIALLLSIYNKAVDTDLHYSSE